jgi:5'(3')-deoxyribonucleotidase
MKRIVTDMDDVIADTLAKYIRVCNSEFGLSLCKADFAGKNLSDVLRREHYPRMRAIVEQEDFFADLEVMPDSQEAIRKLMDRYEVFISSSAMEVPTSFMAKFRWLARHFPFVPPGHIVFCGDKSILNADYLIDDRERHFEHFRGEGILFSAPHNMHVQDYRRVNGWRDVEAMLLEER